MRKLLHASGYLIAILAIAVGLFWGFGFQTAYPPSMATTDELVQRLHATTKHAGDSEVLVESTLLYELVRVALLSRKECQRASQNESVFVVMLLVSGIYLLIVLPRVQPKNVEDVQPHTGG
jgi:hypothetical protein